MNAFQGLIHQATSLEVPLADDVLALFLLGPHGGERVRHADQSNDTRQVGSMLEADRTHLTSHAGMKGDFVGKQAPRMGS